MSVLPGETLWCDVMRSLSLLIVYVNYRAIFVEHGTSVLLVGLVLFWGEIGKWDMWLTSRGTAWLTGFVKEGRELRAKETRHFFALWHYLKSCDSLWSFFFAHETSILPVRSFAPVLQMYKWLLAGHVFGSTGIGFKVFRHFPLPFQGNDDHFISGLTYTLACPCNCMIMALGLFAIRT